MNIDMNKLIGEFQVALGQELNPQAIIMRAAKTAGGNINPMIGNLIKMAENGQLQQLMTFANNFMVEQNIDANQLISQVKNNPDMINDLKNIISQPK